ncbi:hypothetical protein [Sinisalibacter lacisalsi]|uniref:Uncharacterized protein n=1 Tax=Sinisalibacter lacisalsi TaxID=1526570 RepID=A0ABQ1QSH7_9RHOB|nr:hypothetical protein [Sinisalibacter lacisalsi]GGD42634.1 hypothetical protein GCM10011358_28080 [Sinisalibacter lacisalsi]
MTRAADIRDRESLEAWLGGQPREVAIAIAARAAARVMPVWAVYCQTEKAKERELTSLPILRANLISSVAAVSSTNEIVRATDSAYEHASRADADPFADKTRATLTARASINAVGSATARAVARSAFASLAASTADDSAFGAFATSAKNLDAATSVWQAVRHDAEAVDNGASLPWGPLWPDTNPLQEQWTTTRVDWSRPGSPYAFWLRWYESLLDPASHPPIPAPVLYQIALIDEDIWTQGAEAVAEEIARIEAEFETGEDDLDRTISALPPAAPDRVQATKQAMERHRADLPPTFGTILGFIVLEVKRLQDRNYRDADDEEEAKRQIRTLTTIHHAVEALQALVPDGPNMPLDDAEKAEKLGRLYLNKFKEWPRDNADDVVGGVYAMGGEIAGNTIRMGLVAATAFALPMIGVPTQWALGAGVAVFGNKSIAEAAKMVRDSVFSSKS